MDPAVNEDVVTPFWMAASSSSILHLLDSGELGLLWKELQQSKREGAKHQTETGRRVQAVLSWGTGQLVNVEGGRFS